jgi:alanyl-tRNA synthetase
VIVTKKRPSSTARTRKVSPASTADLPWIAFAPAVIVAVNDGKASIAAAVTEDLTAKVSPVDLVRAGVEALGGKGGGGRADMAQGGGGKPEELSRALEAVYDMIGSS